MNNTSPLTLLGAFLILIGIVLVALSLIAKYIPNIENIPWIILWIHRTDGFFFATSPILILISILSLIIHFVTRVDAA